MKKLKTKNLVASLLCLACIGGGAVGLSYMLDSNHESTHETTDNVGFDVVKNDGIRIKMLSSSVDEMTGYVIKTISYSITPSDAKYNQVGWSLEYASGMSVPNEVMEVMVYPDTNTITFTCKQAFSEQIVFKLYSYYNPTISASMTIDYEKKLLGVGFENLPNVELLNQHVGSDGNYTYNVELKQYATPYYSQFSKDKNIDLTFGTFYSGSWNVMGQFYEEVSMISGASQIFDNIGSYIASTITEDGVIPKLDDKAIYDIIATNQEVELKFVTLAQYLNSLGGPDQEYEADDCKIIYKFSGEVNGIISDFYIDVAVHQCDFTKYASVITNVTLESDNLLF